MAETTVPTTSDGGPVFEYAPAPESRAALRLQPSYGLFIGGSFRDTIDGDATISGKSPPRRPSLRATRSCRLRAQSKPRSRE